VERLTGIGVSDGIAVGPALVAIQRTQVIRFPIAVDRVARELSALERARVRSHEQLQQIRNRMAGITGSELAALFDAQLLILDDPMLLGRAAPIVCDERVTPSGRCSGRSTRSPPSSTASKIPTCVSARAICMTSPAGCA
jgi:phosphotransferase system enzyme I (PtsI)